MIRKVRHLTKLDKSFATLELKNAGIKVRTKMLRVGFRVVFEGSWQAVADVLNGNGFRTAAGNPFTETAFDRLGNGEPGAVFVRFMEGA